MRHITHAGTHGNTMQRFLMAPEALALPCMLMYAPLLIRQGAFAGAWE